MEHFVTFVLDRTGSMAIRKQETISGFNSWMEVMETFPGDVIFTLIQFDSISIDFQFQHKLLTTVDPVRLNEELYLPRLWTPLYDAIGKAIIDTAKHLEGEENDISVLMVIMTDGLENASKEWTLEGIKALIKEKTEAGWTFTYLGAGPLAWQGGSDLGFFGGNILNYSSDPMAQTRSMSQHAVATSQYLAGQNNGNISGQPVMDFYKTGEVDGETEDAGKS